ncbi:SusD/RagB family nutrient-binding outer membrane lipoprotein [Pedobacter agri]|uniref:SusD/RagB family nutrient-binding outer membrane lipoprotein n=1 Tax=Pedobacter agri TaxID=454586 RepID=A0A9X3DDD7_9SPHI|nr:SusD/RagB family nutrient-binding outer membrane lipoprotein [Pedobacter agri]MCX3263778.1 SusD/RagB family nutrient-binding outer membrane lipoprotein [Pedobacter agri]
MKKLFIKASFLLIAISTVVGCKKELDEKFNNPEKVLDPSLNGLFTGMLNNDRVAAKYWNVRTFLTQMPGVYAQTSYIANGNTIYQQSDGYSQQYWDDFYSTGGNGSGVLAQYRTMEVKYQSLSAAEQANQKAIMQAAKVVLIEQAAKMVDLWGDIPYSAAGSLNLSSTISNPKYDEQKALYTSFIADLEALATYFNTNTTTSAFSKSDILLKGSMNMWARYANSLRLRLLMRISKTDEATARTAVLAMLANQATSPLIDGDNTAEYNPATSDVLLQTLTNSTSDLRDAFFEGSWYATDYALNTLMLPANDPRIPVIYDKFGRIVKINNRDVFVQNANYRAMPITFTTAQQESSFADYSVLDSATFLFNQKLPGILITSSEVNFLKAEAFERWGNTASAKTAYDKALRQSVTFYHYLNNLNQGGGYRNVTAPSASVVDAWVNSSTATYTGSSTAKLTLIYNQKWLHYGVLQSTEAWSEYRRTGFPLLTFPTAGKLSGFDTPPTRLIYPAKEKTLNSENYQAVVSKDTRKTKIFWMP